MKSATVPSFWEWYHQLDSEIRGRAKKAYRLWAALQINMLNPPPLRRESSTSIPDESGFPFRSNKHPVSSNQHLSAVSNEVIYPHKLAGLRRSFAIYEYLQPIH